jgi:kynurenine formamidase
MPGPLRACILPPQDDPGGGYQLIDLSLLIAEDLPCYWPTHLPFQHKTWNWFVDEAVTGGRVYSRAGPYATKWLAIDEHTGTHIDAPSHFIPPPDSGLAHAGLAGELTVEQIPIGQTIGPAAVVDVAHLAEGSGEPGVSPVIQPEHVAAWEARFGVLQADDIVLFHTGWPAKYRRGQSGLAYAHEVVVTRKLPGWPAPEVPAIELLLDRGVRCVGIDAPSMGPVQGGQGVHVRALETGAVFIEGLASLEEIPPRGAWFCFLALKVEGGTGAPGRAVAWVPLGRSVAEPAD